MVIAQRVSTLTCCIRTAPTVAVVVVAVAGRKYIITTTGNPAQRIHDHGHRKPHRRYHTRPRCIETGTTHGRDEKCWFPYVSSE